MKQRTSPRLSPVLTAIADFARAVNQPVAKRDPRTERWIGEGLCYVTITEWGGVVLGWHDGAGAVSPIAGYLDAIAVNQLAMVGQLVSYFANPASIVPTPDIDAILPPTRKSGTTCPVCCRKIDGDLIRCECAPTTYHLQSTSDLIATAVKTLDTAEARNFSAAANTPGMPRNERKEFETSRQELRAVKEMLRELDVRASTTALTPLVPEIDGFVLADVRVG